MSRRTGADTSGGERSEGLHRAAGDLGQHRCRCGAADRVVQRVSTSDRGRRRCDGRNLRCGNAVRDWVSRLVCSQCGARDISCPHRGTAVGPIDSPNADCARRSRARLFGGLYRRGSEPAEIVRAAAPGRAPWWRRRFREKSSTSDGEYGDGQSPRPTAPYDGTCRADSPMASIVSTLRSFSEL